MSPGNASPAVTSGGGLAVVGLGPGTAAMLTVEAAAALAEAEALYGYGPYLDRVPPRAGQVRHPSDNREELKRAETALAAAGAGGRVALVSGGDPGVFAMAAAVCEAIDHGPDAWRNIELRIVPGITAMLALAARVGAPLGHDFCALSLSDNLKPWAVIERRLTAAASAGFAIALYNPISRSRPWQLGAAFDLLLRHLPGGTPVVFGRAVGRPEEAVAIVPLAAADPNRADMATCIIVGTADTRLIQRGMPLGEGETPSVDCVSGSPFAAPAARPRDGGIAGRLTTRRSDTGAGASSAIAERQVSRPPLVYTPRRASR